MACRAATRVRGCRLPHISDLVFLLFLIFERVASIRNSNVVHRPLPTCRGYALRRLHHPLAQALHRCCLHSRYSGWRQLCPDQVCCCRILVHNPCRCHQTQKEKMMGSRRATASVTVKPFHENNNTHLMYKYFPLRRDATFWLGKSCKSLVKRMLKPLADMPILK